MKDLSSLILDNSFWQFSLKQWKSTSLQQQLLNLQNEQGYRVNILLLSIWLSFERKDIRPHLQNILDKTREWHDQIVTPIRQARQAIPAKLPSPNNALKSQLQNCELQAEQIEQALLFQESMRIPKNDTPELDSLDWLILNLSASDLSKTDLSLLLQNCLPTHPSHHIDERLHAI